MYETVTDAKINRDKSTWLSVGFVEVYLLQGLLLQDLLQLDERALLEEDWLGVIFV